MYIDSIIEFEIVTLAILSSNKYIIIIVVRKIRKYTQEIIPLHITLCTRIFVYVFFLIIASFLYKFYNYCRIL